MDMEKKLALIIKKEGQVAGVRSFLNDLLLQKRVESLLVLLEQEPAAKASMALIKDPGMLQYANPLAPLMPRNGAQLVSEMTRIAPFNKKVGLVLRPCELRALIELVKLNQASLENTVLIGIDCAGTYTLSDYKKYVKEGKKSAMPLRKACQVCRYPYPLYADVVIGLHGMDPAAVLIEAGRPAGNEFLQDSSFTAADKADIDKRQKALAELDKQRPDINLRFFEQLGNEVVGTDKLLDTLSACINCHNCRVMCPICYCRECFFDSPTLDWEADKYQGLVERKGALKLPADTLLYHLTRLNHMATSCVSCGMCSEACPNSIPVFDIFKLVGSRLQEEFSYVPGRSLEEPPPLIVFKEDELNHIGR